MSATRLPAVRLPSIIAGQDASEDVPQESIVVELPPSNKFAIAWPAESQGTVPVHIPVADHSAMLSSSEGETEVSEDQEEQSNVPFRRTTRIEEPETEFATPTNHLDVDSNPMDQVPQAPTVPKLSRAFSMPLPSQLGYLQHPKRPPSSNSSNSSGNSAVSPEVEGYHELSLELADSVQMVIQTLLQLSPPQVLDPAKEQLSACSLSIPTPSLSAMFTSMKNLNYISANMSSFSSNPQSPIPDSTVTDASLQTHRDFDVGEMLQSMGDALSGIAAQCGVDLVLFHGDVGMKHVAVKGDENGVSYTLLHIVRQVIACCERGDAIEIGLFVESLRDNQDVEGYRSTPSPDLNASLRCVFHIAHRFRPGESIDAGRPRPQLSSLILRRLLLHIGATLDLEVQPRVLAFIGHAYDLAIVFEPGNPSVLNPPLSLMPEEAAVVGYPDIAQEPTLEQLLQFTDQLRGKKVILHASSRGSFAHHLSSYLTAWGMDVSHVSTEPETEGERVDLNADPLATAPGTPNLSASEGNSPSNAGSNVRMSSPPLTFILIDDDIKTLRSRLEKIKAEQSYPLTLQGRKRPSLAANHRPRSSPQVARFIGRNTPSPLSPQTQFVIVHFTSLANYKLVQDVMQSSFANYSGVLQRIPEVIVIPKPAGPRRFLTALHTAVTKPVVDPFFMPIATSPLSPGLHGISPLFNFTSAGKSPGGRSTASVRTASDRSAKSPKEPGEVNPHHPSPPLNGPDGMEYFSDAVVKLGTSPSTGFVIQSPDGQPAGIFFHPKARASPSPAVPNPTTSTPKMEREARPEANRNRGTSLRLSPEETKAALPFSHAIPTLMRSSPRPPINSPGGESTPSTDAKGKARQVSTSVSDDLPSSVSIDVTLASPDSTAGSSASRTHMGSSQTSTPPQSPHTRSPGQAGYGRRLSKRQVGEHRPSDLSGKKAKGPGEGNIVPPISVLIVDDNPINQTILSTFMRKRKIKYDVAKNGEEAVHKWKSGTFHLILMDIQMPVMDGIQATKEIRRMEKLNGAVGFPTTPSSEGGQTPSETSLSTSDSRSTVMTPYRSSVIIVALTASSLQADRVAALAAGCNDFLTKPVSLQWLNSKIIEWGSIKALQMWADIRPEVVRSFATGQAAQAQNIARRLHVPEGRMTPTAGRSRSSSITQKAKNTEVFKAVKELASAEVLPSPDTPPSGDSAGLSSNGSINQPTANPMDKVDIPLPEPSSAPSIHDDQANATQEKLGEQPAPINPEETTGVSAVAEDSTSNPASSDGTTDRPPPEPQ